MITCRYDGLPYMYNGYLDHTYNANDNYLKQRAKNLQHNSFSRQLIILGYHQEMFQIRAFSL